MYLYKQKKYMLICHGSSCLYLGQVLDPRFPEPGGMLLSSLHRLCVCGEMALAGKGSHSCLTFPSICTTDPPLLWGLWTSGSFSPGVADKTREVVVPGEEPTAAATWYRWSGSHQLTLRQIFLSIMLREKTRSSMCFVVKGGEGVAEPVGGKVGEERKGRRQEPAGNRG